MSRSLSYSEVSTALSCQAKWDFRYGGHLAGSALKPKRTAPILSEGRAFGAAAAAWHVAIGVGQEDAACEQAALQAMVASLDEDAERQREFGVHSELEHHDLTRRLTRIVRHYTATAEPFPIHAYVEREVDVPLPSRTGVRPSSRYRLLSYLDGWSTDDGGVTWLIEYKLRKTLTSVEQIALSRQIRWYAWAFWRETGIKPFGVKVVERLNEQPKPPRLVQARGKGGGQTPSHAKDQVCTAQDYIDTCAEYGVEPHDDTVSALLARRWQQVVPIMFRDAELEEVGHELVAAGKLIGDLDSGDNIPLRNAAPWNCRACEFRDICADPDQADLVDSLYERTVPKRDRDTDTTQEVAA